MSLTERELLDRLADIERREDEVVKTIALYNRKFDELSHLPLAVDAKREQQLALREQTIRQRESDVRGEESRQRDQRKALAQRELALEQRERQLLSREAAQDQEAARLRSLEHELTVRASSLNNVQAVQSANAIHLDERSRHVEAVAQSNVSREQAFNKARVDRVNAEEARLASESLRLTRWEARLQAEAEQYQQSPLVVEKRLAEANERLDACVKLEKNLTTWQDTLRTQSVALESREAACHALEGKHKEWKDGLEVRELRLQKDERKVQQLIERHHLQAELTA